jgi:transcriptional regulator with GAF, ATPase, and Fis domain
MRTRRRYVCPKHAADFRSSVRKRKKRVRGRRADLLHHRGGPLDSGMDIPARALFGLFGMFRRSSRSPENSSFGAFHRHSYNRIVPKAKDLESRLQRTEQQLQLFQKVSRLMVRELSLQQVLQGIVSLTVEFTQCDSCLVYLLDNEELVLCASNTPHPSTIGKVRLKLNEGLTGWVARERRLLSISREAYKDARFKTFGELPEDSFEAFLSAPVIARNRVVGVVNVQHRMPHQHTGSEMEVLSTMGEQVGCVLVLARMAPTAVESANHVELVMSSGPIRPH